MLALTEGWEQERVKRIVADTLNQVVGPITYKEAVELIAKHKQEGRPVYIVSAAPEEIVEPLARYLGAEEAIASQAAVSAGRYTGQLLNYTYGPQKAATIRLIAARDNLDLTESWAYSDSATDLPMLEAVGHPVVVNPDRALRRIAQMRGWPVLRFSEVMVVTPDGHRPLRVGLVGAAERRAAPRAALGHSSHRQTSLEQRRRWNSEDKGTLPRPLQASAGPQLCSPQFLRGEEANADNEGEEQQLFEHAPHRSAPEGLSASFKVLSASFYADVVLRWALAAPGREVHVRGRPVRQQTAQQGLRRERPSPEMALAHIAT